MGVRHSDDLTDAELMSAAEAGRLGLRRALPPAHRDGARVVPPPPRLGGGDLTAETFAQAWLSRRSFRDEANGSALPWLFGIARNVARESARKDAVEMRARRRLGLPTDLASEDGYAAVEERLDPRGSCPRARDLPEHEREALELRVVDELPYEQVADRLGVRPAAARLRVSRAPGRLSSLALKEDT